MTNIIVLNLAWETMAKLLMPVAVIFRAVILFQVQESYKFLKSSVICIALDLKTCFLHQHLSYLEAIIFPPRIFSFPFSPEAIPVCWQKPLERISHEHELFVFLENCFALRRGKMPQICDFIFNFSVNTFCKGDIHRLCKNSLPNWSCYLRNCAVHKLVLLQHNDSWGQGVKVSLA